MVSTPHQPTRPTYAFPRQVPLATRFGNNILSLLRSTPGPAFTSQGPPTRLRPTPCELSSCLSTTYKNGTAKTTGAELHWVVTTLLHTFDTALSGLRLLFFGGAIVLGALCTIEWSVRSRRLNPFSPWARGTRRLMSPLIKPVERSIVRAGGTPSSAPWWTLIAGVVGGIVTLSALEFLRDEVAYGYLAFSSGPRGIIHLLVKWTFSVLYLALLLRVIASWIRLNPHGRLVRWSYTITEPMLGPLRRALPALGMIDFSPLVAYFLLRLTQTLLLRLV